VKDMLTCFKEQQLIHKRFAFQILLQVRCHMLRSACSPGQNSLSLLCGMVAGRCVGGGSEGTVCMREGGVCV
jgi:hypothetical protein